tara:strand:- start:35 stop:232 length:198 start_codon:yes stop_codon:yes gene_type:complete
VFKNATIKPVCLIIALLNKTVKIVAYMNFLVLKVCCHFLLPGKEMKFCPVPGNKELEVIRCIAID